MKLWSAVLIGTFAVLPVASLHAQGFSDHDKSYLKDTAEGNRAEVKMAQLVLKTTKNAEIRQFAQKMIHDHTALLAGEKPVAAKAGVDLPTSPSTMQDAEYMKLKALSGDSFDKSYVKTMVDDHKHDVQATKDEHDQTQNPEMKKLTAHADAVMSEHLKMIENIAGKMGVTD